MSSRRYPTAELYEERQRDGYRNAHALDFLDDPYASAGPLVISDRREIDQYDSVSSRGRLAPARRARSVEREDITVRRGERDRFRRAAEREEIDVTIRTDKEEVSRPRQRVREIERDERFIRRSETDLGRMARAVDTHRDEITIRQGDRAGRPSRTVRHEDDITIRHSERAGRPSRTIDHEDDITIRHVDRARRPSRTVDLEDDITIRHNGREVRGRDFESDRESIHVRHRSSSRPAPLRGILTRRDEDEVVVRRRRSISSSPSPPPRREVERDEIIIRRERERSLTPPPPLPPPQPRPVILQPIVRPPIHQEIHQEIITHHRHIDHGVERAYSSPSPSPPPIVRTPTPPPSLAPRKVEETIEVDIRRRGRGNSDEEVIIDHRHRSRSRGHQAPMVRHRSLSTGRRRYYDDELEEEADYYNRKAMERARIGEAYNGATRDWEIVDVPPGTERVTMDGAGGSSQEITWQRYNGVRRSKFIAGNREFDTGFGAPDRLEERTVDRRGSPSHLTPSRRPTDMWTEVTKDLIVKDAIEASGYDYEETEFFYYIMEYLHYEDVLQLVELSDDIRRDRRQRIREIEWEREEIHRRPRRGGNRYYEHEVVVSDSRRRH